MCVTLQSPCCCCKQGNAIFYFFFFLACLATQGLTSRGDRQWDQSQVICADIHQHSDCCWLRQHPTAQHASKWETWRGARGKRERDKGGLRETLQPEESREVTLQDRMHGPLLWELWSYSSTAVFSWVGATHMWTFLHFILKCCLLSVLFSFFLTHVL